MTFDEIRKRLEEDGLAGLHEVLRLRRAAFDQNGRLEDFVVAGRIHLDECGNALRMHKKPHDYRGEILMYPSRGSLDPCAELAPLPAAGERCQRCGRGWTLDTAHDYYRSRESTPSGRHIECHRLAVVQHTYEDLKQIVRDAEIPVCSLTLIPSRYHDDKDYFGPWMRVHTPKNIITIGWRKRVMVVDWSESTLNVTTSIFAEEDVTKGEKMIHAWSEEKAVEYLRKIWHG